MHNITPRISKKRAVSTVVGTFFFIIIMVAAFAAFIAMMQTNNEFFRTQLDISQSNIQKINEQFTIAAAYDSGIGNRLCVSVKNTGSYPLEIADLFIVNKTNNVVRQFDIDYRDAFVPVNALHELVENLPITLKPGIHDIKVVSTSGIMQIVELKVFSGSSPDPRLNATVFVGPVNAATATNVTVGMHVYNRMNTTLLNVQPTNGRPSVSPSSAVTGGFPLISNLTISRLDPNEDVLFLWDPEIIGGIGSTLTFTASAKALVEGCTSSSFITSDSDSAKLKIIPGVRRQILASPEIFVSYPSPFGKSSGKGLFAIVVQNPTDKTLSVSQVAVQILPPDSTNILGTITGLTPTSGDWSVSTNVLTWKGTTRIIPAFDMTEFIVRAQPTVTKNFPINSLIFNVYSSYGQFGKGPFTLGYLSSDTAIVNVYARISTAFTNPIFSYQDVPSGSTSTLTFTIANNGSAAIDFTASSFAYMLINIPPGIQFVENVSTEANFEPQDLVEFDDGSSQKAVKLTQGLAAGATKTYSMSVTVPTISVPAHYIFTITANGTSGTALVGPTAEIDVQVCPSPGSGTPCS